MNAMPRRRNNNPKRLAANAAILSLALSNVYAIPEVVVQQDHQGSRKISGSSDPSVITFSEEQCRAWGFEPSQLSCETCDLLKKDDGDRIVAQFFKECKLCCQPWRKNVVDDPDTLGKSTYERIILLVGDDQQNQLLMDGVPPHIAAQLGLMMAASDSPLQELIKSEEFATLVEEKGGDQIIKVEQSSSPNHQGSVILLFTKGNPGSTEDEVDEVIDLEHWRKDDIRDFIKFGLKNQS